MRALFFIFLSCLVTSVTGQVFPSARKVASPAVFVTESGTPHATLNDVLVYWKLDETSGTRADSEPTGTARNLASNNSVGGAAGKIGNAATFVAASTQSLSVADNADLSMGNINVTITLWANLTTKTASMDILGQWAEGGAQTYGYNVRYNQSTDRFEFKIINPGNNIYTVSADNLGAPSTGTWYWIRAFHSADSDALGIAVNNGSSNSILAPSDGINDGVADFSIGGRQNGSVQWFNGMVDEVAIWKRLLTSGERDYLYNSSNGETCCAFLE